MKYRIKALKYGNIPHYEWDAQEVKTTGDYVLVKSERGRALTHHTKKKTFVMNHSSLELFSLTHGFTVSFEIREGRMASVYCNVALPSVLIGGELSFVDLDLDLLFDGERWFVVDEEEFEENRRKYAYPDSLVEYAIEALRELRQRVEECRFPFNGELDDYIRELIQESLNESR
ncbi:DUF402 domain-containing protein [Cohnella thailandensis]|uniref:DUF402 domain-containing protein n=1 Tax=Cohnella thailandensis TaxID=557557 RepID=A0A841T122_9BACL|nr:DUF402 domain-containing protein [Cohnella thailandensis]MBB6635780.1 DUF402 domain-containing protein [Cohnella thailandensis]MBP1976158.1 protein associated with RNAse G/E [Cohnella thailandensis]